MDVKTYRAKSMQDALRMVRTDLGPDASVLQTREIRGGILRWLVGGRQIEITASTSVSVPSRFPEPQYNEGADPQRPDCAGHPHDGQYDDSAHYADRVTRSRTNPGPPIQSHFEQQQEVVRQQIQAELRHHTAPAPELAAMINQLGSPPHGSELPESLFRLYTDLIDAEVSEDLARDLVERVKETTYGSEVDDPMLMKARVARMIEDELLIRGPIQIPPGHGADNRCRLVSLVGPTGVGKTTTIAKLAANFRLREQRRVGLITVDTYRIAAVEQLRTYADIIDLPMEIVSTPREMREAVRRLADLDLVLMDTAGRSPRDEVRIQELRSMLDESRCDEVHLVLSSVSSLSSMKKAAEKFSQVGADSLILTKLDEASGLGNLLPLTRACNLPLSYVTNGQNVPDDIEPAQKRKLTRIILGQTEFV